MTGSAAIRVPDRWAATAALKVVAPFILESEARRDRTTPETH